MSDYIAHTETANGFRLNIIADSDLQNPRKEYDNASVMVCEHRRYDLGDSNGRDSAIEAVLSSRDYRPSWEDEDKADCLDLSEPNHLWTAVQRCSDIIACPLYLYDHSGITISMSRGGGNPFSCQWDSGMVGFVFMTKKAILENWMKPATSRLTAALKKQAEDLMDGEVETYDQYLTGDVYGYVVERLDVTEPDEEGEQEDSCWGFYGLDCAIEEGRAMLAYWAEEEPALPLEAVEA